MDDYHPQLPATGKVPSGLAKPNPRRKKRLKLLAVNPYCKYCGERVTESTSTLDHVLPRSRGGKNQHGNLVLCCLDCNRLKGDKLIIEILKGKDAIT